MSGPYSIEATHPVLGFINCEVIVERWGYGSNGWDDPGEGTEWYLDEVTNLAGTIVWYMPNNDYVSIERLIDDEVQGWDPPGSEENWMRE